MSDPAQLTNFSVFLKLLAGNEAAFLRASRINQAGARNEPGNLRFDIYQSAQDSRHFMFIESYTSVEAVTSHRETPHFLEWLKTIEPMLSEPRKRMPGQAVPPEYKLVP